MPIDLAAGYTSRSQQTRVVSEAWGAENLYCPNCVSPALSPAAPNMEAIDFTCPDCESPFQLKSLSRPFAARIVDAAYRAMRQAIVEDRTPNLVVLHYDPACWEVKNLVLVPRFVFSLSLLERRKPLGPTARRRGWVGCNILLANVPPDARIPIVADGIATSPAWVRQQYARLRPLQKLGHEARGWTLDVLNVVRALLQSRSQESVRELTDRRQETGGTERAPGEFTLAEVYAFADTLRRLHPQNRHVEDKIRQQLQRLRDLGFVEFQGRGVYRLTA